MQSRGLNRLWRRELTVSVLIGSLSPIYKANKIQGNERASRNSTVSQHSHTHIYTHTSFVSSFPPSLSLSLSLSFPDFSFCLLIKHRGRPHIWNCSLALRLAVCLYFSVIISLAFRPYSFITLAMSTSPFCHLIKYR